uniref:Glyco_transf_64 domain-containing protein n=2 Tax=Bursaphelenchus xylophilus TaxID=6326 RepID=A0A1I7SL72_BURXY
MAKYSVLTDDGALPKPVSNITSGQKVLLSCSLLLNAFLITIMYVLTSDEEVTLETYNVKGLARKNVSFALMNNGTVNESVRAFDYKPFLLLYEPVFFNKTRRSKVTSDPFAKTGDEKYTVVILAYKRDDQLNYTLNSFDGLANLDKIIVIWNDVSRAVRKDIIPVIHVPIVVLKMKKNSLNNRFLPIDLIETEAVLNMDDDFNVKHSVMDLMFEVWKSNRRAIVGPNYRYGTVYPDGKRQYGMPKKGIYNMVLTSGAIIHRDLNIAYTTLMYPEIRSQIDEMLNCEDIAINFLAAHLYPPLGAIKVTTDENTVGKFASTGLHQRGKSHYKDREKCLEDFIRIYGYMPLVNRRWKAV